MAKGARPDASCGRCNLRCDAMWRTLLGLIAAVSLIVGPAAGRSAAVSPRLSFVRGGSIHVAGADLRSEAVYVAARLNRGSRYSYSAPAWSPDGASLAAAEFVEPPPDSEGHPYETYFVLPAVGGRNQIGGGDASWSPRGRELVYVEYRTFDPYAAGSLFIYNVATRREKRLTLPRRTDGTPAWSPDGRMIAFVRARAPYEGDQPGRRRLYVLPAAGGTPRLLTTGEAKNPSWSPDGRRIAFDDGRRIGIVRRTGGPVRFIAHGTNPAWSPDGRTIAFERDRGVWFVEPTGARPRRVFRNASDPAWRPPF